MSAEASRMNTLIHHTHINAHQTRLSPKSNFFKLLHRIAKGALYRILIKWGGALPHLAYVPTEGAIDNVVLQYYCHIMAVICVYIAITWPYTAII